MWQSLKKSTPAIIGLALLVGILAFSVLQSEKAQAVATHAAQEQMSFAGTLAEQSAAVNDLYGSRVIQLPEDGNKLYTTLFTSNEWQTNPAERELVAQFTTNPELRSLTMQTNYHHYTPSDKLFVNYWGRTIDRLPALVIQDNSNGPPIYRAYGARPVFPLVYEIRMALHNRFPRLPGPRQPCPDCPDKVVVQNVPMQTPLQPLGPLPEIKPVDDATKEDDSALIAAIAGALILPLGWVVSMLRSFAVS